MERLQKLIAQAGICSRRKAEDLIRTGNVKLNGKTATIGQSADPKTDIITVNGKPLVLQKKIYLILHKPKGYVTTVSEEHGMKTVMDIVKTKEKIFPVGRLDKNTEGLLFLTNDGELAHKLTHPRYGVDKEYHVTLDKPLSQREYEQLEKGIIIDERKVMTKKLEILGKEAMITIHEGRKHIIRRLFEEIGLNVVRLIRIRMGPLQLGKLQLGKYREITPAELKALQNSAKQREKPT